MRASERIEYLDTVRGLAALAVFFSHCIYTCGMPPSLLKLPAWVPIYIALDGHSAVGLFFVLSGFVLSRRFLLKGEGPKLLSFYAARILRIYPAFLFTLALTVVAREVVSRGGTLPGFWAAPVTIRSFFEQALIVFPSSESRLLKQDWSLDWELKFSVVIPALIFLARKGQAYLALFVALGLWIVGAEKFLLHFALGVALAKNWTRLTASYRDRSGVERTLFAVLAIYLYAFRYTPPLNLSFVSNSDLQWYVNAVGSALCLIAVGGSRGFHRYLERGALLWLGRRSYSFFLIHYTVLLALSAVALRLTEFIPSRDGQLSVVVLGLLGLSLLAAEVLYRGVEKPFLILGKKFLRPAPPAVGPISFKEI